MGHHQTLFGLFPSFSRLTDKLYYQVNLINQKVKCTCFAGFKPGAKRWQEQTDQLNYLLMTSPFKTILFDMPMIRIITTKTIHIWRVRWVRCWVSYHLTLHGYYLASKLDDTPKQKYRPSSNRSTKKGIKLVWMGKSGTTLEGIRRTTYD